MYRDIQKFIVADRINYLESYAGYNQRLDKELNNTFKIFFYLTESVDGIWVKNNGADSDRYPWIIDSIIQLSRGMELLNSSLSLMVNNHMPANTYLFRSALNCFWFAHKFIRNGHIWEKYNNGCEGKKTRLSSLEIKDRQLSQVIAGDNFETDIIEAFNGILHSDFEQGWRFKKSDQGGSFELSPHEFETDSLVHLFEESIINIRGIMEFARCVIQSTFLDKKPDDLLNGSYFKSGNITTLWSKDYREQCEIIQKSNEIDLSHYF